MMMDSNIDSSTSSFLSGKVDPSVEHESDHVFGPLAKSCSAGVPFEVRVLDTERDQEETRHFHEGFVLIGRSPECDLVLPHLDVSFRHAYIQEIFGRFVCVDLVSRTGTHWEDGPHPFGWFDETPVMIGPYRLQFSTSEEAESYESQSSIFATPEFDPQAFFRRQSEQNRLPEVGLEVLGRRRERETWSVQRAITLIGSSPRCKLRLQHKSVSKVHCCLSLKPDGLWIADLLGKKGTLVDGEPIRSQHLHDGAILKIGKYEFRVHYESSNGEHGELSENQKQVPQAGPPAGVSEHAMSQLIGQIADMQKQFLDQSSQQTRMMLEFFSMMHTNQHELLREELNRVHKIDDELRELRQLVANSQISQPTGKSTVQEEAATEPDVKSPEADSSPSLMPRLEEPRPELPQSAEPQETPAEESGLHSSSAEKELETDSLPSEETTAEDSDEHAAAEMPAEALDDSQADEEEQSVPLELADESHHAQVMQRMFALEKEKENILKRMMRSVFN